MRTAGFHSLGDAAIIGAETGILAEVGAPATTASSAFVDAAHRAARGFYAGDAVAAHGGTCDLGQTRVTSLRNVAADYQKTYHTRSEYWSTAA